jgi:hypothetical protein
MMKLDQIKNAVDSGLVVHWSNDGYQVIKGHEYLIGWDIGGRQENYIGLTWADGKTLNGKEDDFYIGESHAN